jgi:glycine/D-amino acid oxidase-like deaminating enzyme
VAVSTEREVDLLVAGAGAGGMAAALVAALEGLEVLLCEKSAQVGGTSATSAGTVWIPCNTQSRDAGFGDSMDSARLYLERLVESGERRELRETFRGARSSSSRRGAIPITASCRARRKPAAAWWQRSSTGVCSTESSPACARRSPSSCCSGA